ncbi:substrate-binding domain-containing protein [Pseudoroseicyclus aestuarii]|uniref:LacI family transcriptional regulator n=1 Tax=Pseudoroseicyclus aestuarii TaxID=1795041 RepID=A0A318STF0_9RHOB|nr:substrate-binding domain-containing protein [Pseudoroseicyclus aestuarii]PYE82449.1 LacI family transcriptional regulator [Pseudoroseicyclus aestuarii]
MARGPGADQERPTLRTIAEATGLSLSTVSLALRDGDRLKADTRRRVIEAARRLGYVPDLAGVRLRTGRSNTIGLILDGREESLGFSRMLMQGISGAVRAKGMALNVFPQFERSETLPLIGSLLRDQTVEGLILTHTEPQDDRVKLLLENGLPFVTHGRTELYTPHAFHDFDTAAFMQTAVRLLAERGARRLLAVLSDNRTFNHHQARRSFLDSAAQLGLEAEVQEDQPEGGDHVGRLRLLGRSIAGQGRTDAVICDSELAGISIASGLREAGCRIGADLQVASKQTSQLLPALFPEVLCLREDVPASGAELARLLFARLGDEPATKLQTLAAPLIAPGDKPAA